jgi:hypothetical protein
MRRIVVLAAMLAVLGMVSQGAEAGNRGTGFRHISPHVGATFHGFKLRRPGFVGKRNALKFGRARLFKPRPFSRFGRSGLVLKFSDGAFALQFGHVPHFKPHPFGLGHGGLLFRFGAWRHFKPLRPRGLTVGKPWQHLRSRHLTGFDDSSWGSEPSRHGAAPIPASFEAVLRQLEEQGFRHVPKLLREQSDWQP